MKSHTDISQVKAEVLLGLRYPHLKEKWIAENKGTFYRNYNQDLLRADENFAVAWLSRDGFLDLMPSGLIAPEDALKGKDFQSKYEQLKKREALLRELFRPLDSFQLRRQVELDEVVGNLVGQKHDFFLRRYFDIPESYKENIYVKEILFLLQYVRRLRGDFSVVRRLLQQLLKYPVKMQVGRYTWSDDIQDSQPYVEYRVIAPQLDNSTLNILCNNLIPLQDFINEWFIPFDTVCRIVVKDYSNNNTVKENLSLDYNTRLSK